MSVISIRNLTKHYGKFCALENLSVDVEQGSVFGLLGPNGAGKTTTFKTVLGLARPDTGEVFFDGAPLEPKLFDRLAYVPERSVLYDWMTIGEHLEMQKRTFSRYNQRTASELLELFGLPRKKKVAKLSKGMRTATAITMAFAIDPDILILDEPTSGLDPVNQRSVLKLIIDSAAVGKTIVFSSHQIGQVERAADHIAILQKGKLVLSGAVDDLKAGYKIVEGIFDAESISPNGLAADRRVTRVETAGRLLRAIVRDDSNGVADEMQRMGAANVRTLDLNLEDIFLNAVDPGSKVSEQ